ncbi:MAG: hypothetical protein WD876_03765 [Candidatus Pacearchaeota archaeon]
MEFLGLMTDVLFQRFRKRFPPINDYERISTYGADERIYLDLITLEFTKGKYINPQEEIKGLAQKVFDVNFIWKNLNDGGTKRLTLIFDPGKQISEESFIYHENYSGHSIDINLPASHPEITISTGHRGKVVLLDRQRDKYFEFAEGVYNIFLDNAK